MPKIEHEFNYQTWNADTRLSLVRVPWDNMYRDVVRFVGGRNALDAWIDSQETPSGTLDRVSYAKVNRPIRVNIPFNAVQKYNYVRASNGIMPVPGDEQRNWYYFILEARYVAPNTTELIVQLDFWQSFVYDIEVTQAFVERGHIGIANTNRFNNNGRDYLTIPEGLDVGSDYQIIAKRSNEIMGLTVSSGTFAFQYDILVISTIDLTNEDVGTVESPKKWAATGSTFEGLTHGATFYVFNGIEAFSAWVSGMSGKPWVTQGIISITVIPKLTRYNPGFDYGSYFMKDASAFLPAPVTHTFFPNWRNSSEIRDKIPTRYQHVKDKFFTSPYMFLEITTWTGAPVVLRPESWNNADAKVLERATFTPPNQRVEFLPRGYNSKTGSGVENFGGLPDSVISSMSAPYNTRWNDAGDDNGDYLDVSAKVASFPTMAILNDQSTLYLASNAHGINQQFNQATWAQNKAMRAAAVSYDQTSSGINTSSDLATIARLADAAGTAIGNDAALQSWGANAAMGIGTGVASGALAGPAGAAVGAMGGAASALASGVNTGIQVDTANRQLANRQSASKASTSLQTNNAEYVRDSNRSMAEYAAKGDAAQNRAAIMARIQDAHILPPSMVGQMGGETMNLVNMAFEVSVRWKLIDEANIKRIGEFWLRFGYAVESFVANIPADLHVMSKFTYWKLSEAYISNAPVPEAARQVIKGILEKGVTVYKTPEDIGTVDYATNAPIGGISY